jgi:hypothetical protein
MRMQKTRLIKNINLKNMLYPSEMNIPENVLPNEPFMKSIDIATLMMARNPSVSFLLITNSSTRITSAADMKISSGRNILKSGYCIVPPIYLISPTIFCARSAVAEALP